MSESTKTEVFCKRKFERVPRTFKDVARVLQEVRTCRKSLKFAVYSSKYKGHVLRKIYGMASSVLKNMPALNFIKKEVKLGSKKLSFSQEMFEVLANEVIKQHPLPGKSKPVLAVEEFREKIGKAYTKFQNQNSISCNTACDYVPRYARIQTVITSIDAVLEFLQSNGYVQKSVDSTASLKRYQKMVKKLKGGEFMLDNDFSDVLVFSEVENLVDMQLYKNGHIFLQDKASYIPVHVLDPEPGSVVIDSCAAPGMKTAHLACVMQNNGHIIAVDKDVARIVTLRKILERGSVKNCTVLCEDFTHINPNEEPYCSVQYILVDPSCSGSGMVEIAKYADCDTQYDKSRIAKLARFQITLLKHALSFPQVKRVVYSTCSVHEEENEFVVGEALAAYSGTYQVVCALPKWPTRGSENYSFGDLCVRASPEKNLTKGFFVSVFERV